MITFLILVYSHKHHQNHHKQISFPQIARTMLPAIALLDIQFAEHSMRLLHSTVLTPCSCRCLFVWLKCCASIWNESVWYDGKPLNNTREKYIQRILRLIFFSFFFCSFPHSLEEKTANQRHQDEPNKEMRSCCVRTLRDVDNEIYSAPPTIEKSILMQTFCCCRRFVMSFFTQSHACIGTST